MPAKTCTWTVDRNGAFVVPCGRPATWVVGMSDGWDRAEIGVCDEHLVDAQDADDYVGARGA